MPANSPDPDPPIFNTITPAGLSIPSTDDVSGICYHFFYLRMVYVYVILHFVIAVGRPS